MGIIQSSLIFPDQDNCKPSVQIVFVMSLQSIKLDRKEYDPLKAVRDHNVAFSSQPRSSFIINP